MFTNIINSNKRVFTLKTNRKHETQVQKITGIGMFINRRN